MSNGKSRNYRIWDGLGITACGKEPLDEIIVGFGRSGLRGGSQRGIYVGTVTVTGADPSQSAELSADSTGPQFHWGQNSQPKQY